MTNETTTPKKPSKFKQWLKNDTPSQRHSAFLDMKHSVSGFKVIYFTDNKSHKLRTKGMTATLEVGATANSYASKGAVGAGAVVGAIALGPVGAIAGGLLGSAKRKGGTRLFITLHKDGAFVGSFDVSADKEAEARKFVRVLEASANDPENAG